MITGLMSISIYVLNLEEALRFYVNTLGFKVHTDIIIGEDVKWASVCSCTQPENQIMLIPVEAGGLFSKEQASNLRSLIREGMFSYGVFRCRNLCSTHRLLKSKGVRFLMEPGVGFLGQYEASFVDDSGNWFRLTEALDAV